MVLFGPTRLLRRLFREVSRRDHSLMKLNSTPVTRVRLTRFREIDIRSMRYVFKLTLRSNLNFDVVFSLRVITTHIHIQKLFMGVNHE